MGASPVTMAVLVAVCSADGADVKLALELVKVDAVLV